MSLSLLPPGYDARRLCGPDDALFDQGEENAEIDLAYGRAKDDAVREAAGELRRELARDDTGDRRKA